MYVLHVCMHAPSLLLLSIMRYWVRVTANGAPPEELWLHLEEPEPESEPHARADDEEDGILLSSPVVSAAAAATASADDERPVPSPEVLTRAEILRRRAKEKAEATKAAARAQMTPRRTRANSNAMRAAGVGAEAQPTTKLGRLKRALPSRKSKRQVGKEHGATKVNAHAAAAFEAEEEGDAEAGS
jgi:hypothetical protein